MKHWPSFQSQKGFISVVAIAIFAILSIFGVIIQATLIDTIDSVQNNNNYYSTRDLADSTVEYLRNMVKDREAGYNVEQNCTYLQRGPTMRLVGGSRSLCPSQNDIPLSERVTVSITIKGRSEPDEKLDVDCPEIGGDGCYVVPFPGTGDAGTRCDLYQAQPPAFEKNATGEQNVSDSIHGAGHEVPQIDYSCNWNRLTFGSNLTDRVAIPLYYEEDPDLPLVSPFRDRPAEANNFLLRIRPPCLPCVYNHRELRTGITRLCQPNQDETVCEMDDRYELDPGNFTQEENKVVVQWSITGVCGDSEEACGMVPLIDYDDDTGREETGFSGISEVRIESMKDLNGNNILLDNFTIGKDINFLIDNPTILNLNESPQLRDYKQPILTLFLSESLISARDKNIPYLEYQLLTDYPVGDSKNRINATIDQDNNLFTKELTIEEQKGLIDFAVQN